MSGWNLTRVSEEEMDLIWEEREEGGGLGEGLGETQMRLGVASQNGREGHPNIEGRWDA